jgi:hypothetical protein
MTKGAKRRQGATPVPIRFAAHERALYRLIAARASAQDRSLSGQIKHYARLGMIAEDNPDLPLALIAGILEAREELKAGLGHPYRWGVLNGHQEREGDVPHPGGAPQPMVGGSVVAGRWIEDSEDE